MEANLLRYLVQHEGKAVSRKNMLEDVWNLREDTDTRAIDHFIARLRKYIEKVPARPRHLLTVRGVGYKFVAGPEIVAHLSQALPTTRQRRSRIRCAAAGTDAARTRPLADRSVSRMASVV